MSRRILLSAVGAVLFFALDSFHVRIGIWKATGAHGIPPWFVLVYFLGIFAAASLLHRVERIGRPASPPRLWLDVAMFAVLLAAHARFFDREGWLTVVAMIILVGRLALFREPKDLSIAAGVAGLEAGVEVSLAKLGLFSYAYASLGPLPLWHLPFWAGLALCIRGFFRAAELSENRARSHREDHVAAHPNHAA